MSLAIAAQKAWLSDQAQKRAEREAEAERRKAEFGDVIDLAMGAFDAWLRTGDTTKVVPEVDLEVDSVVSTGGYNLNKTLPAEVIFRADRMRFKVVFDYPPYDNSPSSIYVEVNRNDITGERVRSWFIVPTLIALGQLIDRNHVVMYD